MAPKRKAHVTLKEMLERPFCYYCDRDFDDFKQLSDHQRAKHYVCQVRTCGRRLNTVGGLSVHMQQVHKEDLFEVPCAMDGRKDTKIEIFCMDGIPDDVIAQRTEHIVREYHKRELEHYKKTGNPLPGSGREHVSKKPKIEESTEDRKARVAAIKAQKAAEKAAKAAGLPIDGPAPNPAPPAIGNPAPATEAINGWADPIMQMPAHVLQQIPQMAQQMPQQMPMPMAAIGYGQQAPGYGPAPGHFAPPPQMQPPMPASLKDDPDTYPLKDPATKELFPDDAAKNVPSPARQAISQTPVAQAASADKLIDGIFDNDGQVPARFRIPPADAVAAVNTKTVDEQTAPVSPKPVPAKVEKAPPAKNERQLLTNNLVSFEEKRAGSARYQIKAESKPKRHLSQSANQWPLMTYQISPTNDQAPLVAETAS